MQYSLFTHGSALEIETPGALADSIKVGWGTRITFRAPVEENEHGLSVFPEEGGPGSWFHIALPSTLTTFGRRNPRLTSITLLLDTQHCRIQRVHVYDGPDLVQDFPMGVALEGQFLDKRNSQDVNPEVSFTNPQAYRNTFLLDKPHSVFSAIGISFFARALQEDFAKDTHGHLQRAESVLTVSAAGGQFLVESNFSFVASTVAVLQKFIGLAR